MAISWKPGEFKIGINMAGAVSAGAYTAGVLDFLMEALEEWQKAKNALRTYLAHPNGDPPEVVPLHDVSIEIFTGASAGGMCAAISSVMVQQDFDHIRTAEDAEIAENGTNNTFFQSWVNSIDIHELLKSDDIEGGNPVISLLDSTIIDSIAAKALTPSTPVPRPYISPQLTLMLTLSNVRGTPYKLYDDPNPGTDEFVEYFGDKLRFEVTKDGTTSTRVAKPLPSGQPGKLAWPLLQEAAKATGAFPIFLAPRIIVRDVADYDLAPWTSCDPGSKTVKPSFPPVMPATLRTLNIDGGVTDNNPFDLANDFLVVQNPQARNNDNPSSPLTANCAVVTVAPFPADDKFDPQYNPEANADVFTMLGRVFSVLISQSRFQGESLESITGGVSFSRFTIAPSDDFKLPDGSVLLCGLLGAFGGFFERGFRVHDFLLGRRNCQKFLRDHFCLPQGNPVVDAGQASAGRFAEEIGRGFFMGPPNDQVQIKDKVWMPVIPLIGSAKNEAPEPDWIQISNRSLDEIVNGVFARTEALKRGWTRDAPELVRLLVDAIVNPLVAALLKPKVREALMDKLSPFVEGQPMEELRQRQSSGTEK